MPTRCPCVDERTTEHPPLASHLDYELVMSVMAERERLTTMERAELVELR